MCNKLLERRFALNQGQWPFLDLWEQQQVCGFWRCQSSHFLFMFSGVLVETWVIPTHTLHTKPRVQPSDSRDGA